jgi:hypothetical protein
MNTAFANASKLSCGALAANYAPTVRTSLSGCAVASLLNLDEE